MPARRHVVVLGAGVVGLSTALRLSQELPGTAITVVADRFDLDTTTSGAAGLWEPFKLSDTPPELVNRWGGETFAYLEARTSRDLMLYALLVLREVPCVWCCLPSNPNCVACRGCLCPLRERLRESLSSRGTSYGRSLTRTPTGRGSCLISTAFQTQNLHRTMPQVDPFSSILCSFF